MSGIKRNCIPSQFVWFRGLHRVEADTDLMGPYRCRESYQVKLHNLISDCEPMFGKINFGCQTEAGTIITGVVGWQWMSLYQLSVVAQVRAAGVGQLLGKCLTSSPAKLLRLLSNKFKMVGPAL